MNLNPKKRRKKEYQEKAKKLEAKREANDSDEDGHFDKNGNKKRRHDASKEETPARPQIDITNLPKVDYSMAKSFQKCFWEGEKGQSVPSEDLKELRKSIGVLVKGALDQCPPPLMGMADSACPESFRKVFDALNLKEASTVQKQCWPAALAGSNVLGIAPTGSGKTLAYLMPMVPHILHQIEAEARRYSNVQAPKKSLIDRLSPVALVLAPTRELAIQINAVCSTLRRNFGLAAGAIYGGQNKEEQLNELRTADGLKVAVATPGRLLDLIASKQMSLSKVTYFVIDEADRMLQLGFMEQLQAISDQIRPDRQTLLFSATFPGKLREASQAWVRILFYVLPSFLFLFVVSCHTFSLSLSPGG
jgi:superfamily II DNA/RNA helicase